MGRLMTSEVYLKSQKVIFQLETCTNKFANTGEHQIKNKLALGFPEGIMNVNATKKRFTSSSH